MPLIILPNAFGDAATNMAIDASLLNTLPTNTAAFRHYAWTEPAITFGYTQAIKTVQAIIPENLRLCRRLTGGGIVDHRNDWTYALVLQSTLPAAQLPATELYAIIHRCLQQALQRQLIESELAPCPRACKPTAMPAIHSSDQCFVQATANDVIRPDGVKIAGAAMKRTRDGRLVQGSIDRAALPDELDLHAFATSFQQALAEQLALPIGTMEAIHSLFNRTLIEAERQRFESMAWQAKR